MNRHLPKTEAQKVAEKIAKLLSDVNLDLDKVGFYLANQGTMNYNRLMTICESAEWEKEQAYDKNTLF